MCAVTVAFPIDCGGTAREDRSAGLLTDFLNTDAQHTLKFMSAVLVAGHNIVFHLFLPPFLMHKRS